MRSFPATSGLGLMWAIEFGPPQRSARRSVYNAAERAQPGIFSQLIVGPLFHKHRVLCQVAGHRMNVVKALPALVVEEDEIRSTSPLLWRTWWRAPSESRRHSCASR